MSKRINNRKGKLPVKPKKPTKLQKRIAGQRLAAMQHIKP